MRHAISSNEEIWVRLCHRFFLEYGFYDWYRVSRENAFTAMMSYSDGSANPHDIKKRIDTLYDSAGVK